ncbi:hypothetical protein [Bradyrhizobium sp.]|uniref:hypothetical protein n=1 Tax=unclassified Bradyrhizobium TaxID=2631580 RepID=UPI001651F78A|nr:hypothetical protein [Bradyrhizobium sp.]
MTKILPALLALAMMTAAASAQQRSFYDASGRRIGSATTDSQGTTTFYDARGRVVGRQATSGNTTTVYDAGGRNVGRGTTSR